MACQLADPNKPVSRAAHTPKVTATSSSHLDTRVPQRGCLLCLQQLVRRSTNSTLQHALCQSAGLKQSIELLEVWHFGRRLRAGIFGNNTNTCTKNYDPLPSTAWQSEDKTCYTMPKHKGARTKCAFELHGLRPPPPLPTIGLLVRSRTCAPGTWPRSPEHVCQRATPRPRLHFV